MNVTSADELLGRAEADPASVVADWDAIGELDDPGERVRWLWAVGVAERSLGNVDRSLTALERAREVARRNGLRAEELEVAISLAASTAMSGNMADALALLDEAETTDDPLTRAHGATQRAGIIARMGALVDAEALYRRALPVLEEHQDSRWLALLHSNRGLVRCYLGDFDGAERSLAAAIGIYSALGRPSSRAEMLVNLGFVAVQRGDIGRGLELLDEAAEEYERHDLPIHTVAVERANAMALGGLPAPAGELLKGQVPELRRSGRMLEAAECLYNAGVAFLAAGFFGEAEAMATRAADAMSAQNRPVWAALASLIRMTAIEEAGRELHIEEARQAALELEEASQRWAAHRALLLTTRTLNRAGDLIGAERELEKACSLARASDPLVMKVELQHAKALNDLARGRRNIALTRLWSASRLADRHRATLVGLEARSGVERVSRHVARLGLELLAAAGRPSRQVEWLELHRASSFRMVDVVRPREKRVEKLMAELRGIEAELAASPDAFDDVRSLHRRRHDLELELRRLHMAAGADHRVLDPASVADLRQRLNDREMVVFSFAAGRLRAIRLRQGSIRGFDLGESDRAVLLARAIRHRLRAALVEGTWDVNVLSDELAGARRLLIEPLRLRGREVIVVPPPELSSMPFSLIVGSHARGVVVAPSGTLWRRADMSPVRRSQVAVLVGPDLLVAEEEGRAVAASYPRAELLVPPASTVEACLDLLSGIDVAHLACHTTLRPDNPMFSALRVAFGQLNLYELDRLERAPSTVVLSSCNSAVGVAEAGYEFLGLATVFLLRGTRTVIAPVAPLPDHQETASSMIELHRLLASGVAPSEAVSRMQMMRPSLLTSSFVAIGA